MDLNNNSDITELIVKWSAGNKQAEEQLYLYSYQNFKQLARKVRQKSASKYDQEQFSLMNIAANTASLVHEAYIKINQNKQIDHLLIVLPMRGCKKMWSRVCDGVGL